MKKLFMIMILGLCLIGCYKLPPVGSVTVNLDKTLEQTRLTEDVWKIKDLITNEIKYTTFINLDASNVLNTHYIMFDIDFSPAQEFVCFKIHDTQEEHITSLVINNFQNKVILNAPPYSKERIKIKRIHDFYGVSNYDKGHSIVFLDFKFAERLLKILETNEPIKIELNCIDKDPVSYKINEKYKNTLIDYLKIILSAKKGNN